MKLKKLFPTLLMTLPLLFTQCKKEEPAPKEPKPDTKVETVTLRIENLGTKTTLSNDSKVFWTDGDVVTINGKTYHIEIDAADKSKAVVKDVEKSEAYVGTYLDGGVRADGQVAVAFKSSLTYSEGTFATNENPMIAYSETETLQFNNAGGILKAGFVSDDNIQIEAIILKSNAGEAIAGTYVYNVSDLADGDFDNGAFAGNASASSVAMNIASPVQLGSEAQYFYFILPAGTYEGGLTIDITDAEGNVSSCPSTGSITIRRAEIAEMGTPINIEKGDEPVPGPEASEWGIVGEFNDWGSEGDPDIVMYRTDTENLFVARDITISGNFKIRANNEWNDAKNYGLANAGTVTADHYYALICGNASQNITIAEGTYDIWFDLTGSKIYVMTSGNDMANAENGMETPTTDTYDILGTLVGNYWKDPVVMTPEDGLYVAKGLEFDWAINLSKDETSELSEFKIRRNADWNSQYGSAEYGTRYAINTSIQLVAKQGDADPANVSFEQTGTFDIWFDPGTSKVWIMTPGYKPGENVPDTWGLIGDFLENSWKTDIVLVEDGEWLSAKNVTFNSFEFKIRANKAWTEGAKNLGMPMNSAPAELNTAIALTDASKGNANIVLNGTPGTYDVYFKVSAKEVWVMACGYRPGDEIPVPEITVSAGATIEEFTKTTIEW